jgi:hypothetical protein
MFSSSREFSEIVDALLDREFKDGNLTLSGEFRDRGIDALFRGKYGRSKGVWLFQYKYHSSAQGRTQVRRLIRRDLKMELSRVREPHLDYYVLVTNVELIRADFDWIERSFRKLPYKVRVWDGKKLSASLLRYPTLLARVSGAFVGNLFTPTEYRKRLSQLNTFLDYSSPMVGREKEIGDLLQLLSTKDQSLVRVHGSDGCGKTRLVLELASRSPGCRFLLAKEIDKHIIPEIKETEIVIIDDAHRITNLWLLATLLESGAKFILVYPSHSATVVSSQLGALETISAKIDIADLSRSNRVSILRTQFPKLTDEIVTDIEHNARGNLVLQSLMAFCYGQGHFRTEDFPAWYIANAIPRNKLARSILRILAGLDPVELSDGIAEKIARLAASKKHAVLYHVDALASSKVLQAQDRRFRFRSQVLRRFILSRACVGKGGLVTGFHAELMASFTECSAQLIPNLTIAEYDSNNQFLDRYLDSELRLLKTQDDTNVHRFVLGETLPTLVQLRPSWAARMIETILDNPMPAYTMKDSFWGPLTIAHDQIVRKMIPILETLSRFVEYSIFSRDKLLFIYLNFPSLAKDGSDAIKRLFRMTYHRDFIVLEERMRFSTEILEKLLNDLAEAGVGKIGPEMVEESLRTELEIVKSDPAKPLTISLTRIPLPSLPHLVKFRQRAWKELLAFLNNDSAEVLDAALNSITSALHGILRRADAAGFDRLTYQNEIRYTITQLENFVSDQIAKSNWTRLVRIGQMVDDLARHDIFKTELAALRVTFSDLESNSQFSLYRTLQDSKLLLKPDMRRELIFGKISKLDRAELVAMINDLVERESDSEILNLVPGALMDLAQRQTDLASEIAAALPEEEAFIGILAGLTAGLRKAGTGVSLPDTIGDRVLALSYVLSGVTTSDMSELKRLAHSDSAQIRRHVLTAITYDKTLDKNSLFALLEISSQNMPRDALETWFQALATHLDQLTGEEIAPLVQRFEAEDIRWRDTMTTYYFNKILGKIAGWSISWVIRFLEKRLQIKQANAKFEAIPFEIGDVFLDVAKSDSGQTQFVDSMIDMGRQGGVYLYYAKRILSETIKTITPATENAFRKLSEEPDIEGVRVLVGLLGGLEEDAAFYRILLQVLNTVDRFSPTEQEEVKASLSRAIFESGGAETRPVGAPSPRLTRRLEFLRGIYKETNPAGRRFIASEIKFCEEQLKRESEEEEEF